MKCGTTGEGGVGRSLDLLNEPGSGPIRRPRHQVLIKEGVVVDVSSLVYIRGKVRIERQNSHASSGQGAVRRRGGQ